MNFARTFRVLSLSSLFAVTACTNDSSPASTSTTTPASTTSTTIAWAPGAAQKAWNKYVKMFYTTDVSQISKSECGLFAMMITEGSLTLYQWNGERWYDNSAMLNGGKGAVPLKVYTHDFTNDGTLDFFVTYGDNLQRGGRTYGAFFAFPWTAEHMCNWNWVDIDNGRDITKTIDEPEVDQRHGIVYAKGYQSGKYLTVGTVNFLPSSSTFVFQQSFTKKTASTP